MLVYIPQLTKRKSKLAEMKSKLPKYRVAELGRISNIIDYTYLNYDLSEVEADYARVSDELANAQLALDAINNRDTLELSLLSAFRRAERSAMRAFWFTFGF